MGISFLITLREGLEMSLVVAILFAYLAKVDRRDRFPAAWGGIVAAAVVCVVAGVSVHLMVGSLTGKAEQGVEAVLAFTAAGVLTWMVFWMRRNARGISGELRSRLDAAISGSGVAVALVAFVAVAREGFETVLFLTGAEAEGATGAEVVVGGMVGLVVAGLLGVAVYRGGRSIDVGLFFRWTGAVLLLFAAGLFAKGVHETRELLEVEWSAVARPAWTVTQGPFADGRGLSDFLAGLFGWSPSPERVRVAAYLLYLLPVAVIYRRPLERAAPNAGLDPAA